ncbi:PD-(D/E)XK nuclease family protein [Kineococcus sp. SYSU DK005]|uniref:PD-(D/E)XK nuclease family protein n=1 Tax=Kineococcus sp. SYSU DK005 TaxID=3383126 RepID=UPI003D7C7614
MAHVLTGGAGGGVRDGGGAAGGPGAEDGPGAAAAPPEPVVPLLRRAPRAGPVHPELDPAQRAVAATRPGSGPLVLRGAPGTGRTTALRALVAARVERDGLAPDRVLVLAPGRREAGALRDELSLALRRTVGQPAARTPQSYAFGLLRAVHAHRGDPPPRLIPGAEQDSILAELLQGHLEAGAEVDDEAGARTGDEVAGAFAAALRAAGRGGAVRAPRWPSDVPREAWGLRSFRNELRDLLARAVERGLGPEDLAELGARHGRPEWVAAASVLAEYAGVTTFDPARANAYDPAAVLDEAVAQLTGTPGALAAERDRWQLVAVDDAHELSEAGLRLVEAVAGGGRDLLLVTDPDSVTQGFRGADALAASALADRFGAADGGPAATVVLGTVHRQQPQVRAVASAVAARIGALGGAPQRAARPGRAPGAGPVPGGVEVAVLPSPTGEAAWIAQRLRRRHLLDGVPWSAMAVVVRSAGRTAALRRGLVAAGVPLAVPQAEVPVRDEPAVRPLLAALGAVLRPASFTAEVARELVTSPLGGADVVALRRLRQRLRRAELAAGGGRTGDAVLASALAGVLAGDPAGGDPAGGDPAGDGPAAADRALLAGDDEALGPAQRLAAVLRAGRAAVLAPDADVERVLWALWEAAGLGPRWQRAALARGASARAEAARADRDLDAVLALFEAAGRFVDRFPGVGGAERFLDQLLSEEVPEDTLAERAPETGAVTLTTPQGAVGREWDLVVVAGVQEGVWPDLRLRGSVLGAQALVDVLQGRAADAPGARRAVLEDELRLFHVAVSRARDELVVTAVRTEDERPSAFLDLVDAAVRPAGAAPELDEEGERPLAPVPRPLSLPALVARLRQVVCAPGGVEPPARRAAAAAQLARLAAVGVPGADPDDWYGVDELTDDGPLGAGAAPVPVSPSRVEVFERCGLRWLLDSSGARPRASGAQALGELVHRVAAEAPGADAAELHRRLDLRWPALGLPDGWVTSRLRARAEAMLVKLAEYHRRAAEEGRELVAVEQDVELVVGGARVRARVDRLERDELGRAVVVDLKTGATAPSKGELARHPQLGVYQLLAQEGAFAPRAAGTGGAVLVQLGSAHRGVAVQRQEALDADEDPRWAADLLARTAEGMAAPVFEAVVGEHCSSCPVRSSCPAQDTGRSVCEEGL